MIQDFNLAKNSNPSTGAEQRFSKWLYGLVKRAISSQDSPILKFCRFFSLDMGSDLRLERFIVHRWLEPWNDISCVYTLHTVISSKVILCFIISFQNSAKPEHR